MAARRFDPAAFRPDRTARSAAAPSRRQTLALLALLIAVAGGVALASVLVKPSRARAFSLFHGSIYIDDQRAPVAVDLTTGKPTVRLLDAAAQVSSTDSSTLRVIPLSGGTLLLNSDTGEFNLLDQSGFVVKRTGGGVALTDSGPTTAVAAGADAYLVPSGTQSGTVYLVTANTVETAAAGAPHVVPRAKAELPGALAAVPSRLVTADHDLWALGTAGAAHKADDGGTGLVVRRLAVPLGSADDAALRVTTAATIPGPVGALGVATRRTDGTGGDVVGAAGPSTVQLFRSGRRVATVPVRGLSGVDTIVAGANQTGTLDYLYRSASGWSFVTVPADGGRAVIPIPLPNIAPTATLVPPAVSDGRAYTLDSAGSATLWQIDASGARSVDGAAFYPVKHAAGGAAQETSALPDGYVLARGSRVVFDSASHEQALAVFSDGSHTPVIIRKGAATAVNASGGAAALAAQHSASRTPTPTRPRTPTPSPSAPTPSAPPAPINNAIDCRTAHQKPHIPQVTAVTPGSDQVQLAWRYPTLDPQDCLPSTYVVSIRLLSADAPSPPGSVTVQGSDGVVITKLFPSTQYELTLTAYINGVGTATEPFRVTTGPKGPDAPTRVVASVNPDGSWHLAWTSCGGRLQGCVPAAVWTVNAAVCDGRAGLVQLDPISRAGDATETSFTADYPATAGGASLLGRGLRFTVVGLGADSRAGGTAASGCTTSWAPPVASAIHVSSSVDPGTGSGDQQDAVVTLGFVGDPVVDSGGVGASYTYRLLQGGAVVATAGPTAAPTITFPGLIRPGLSYQAQVVVTPPVHPAAAVTLPTVDLDRAVAPWPTPTVQTSFATTDPSSGTLTVAIGGINSATANGEQFVLDPASGLTCGSSRFDLHGDGLTLPASLTFTVNRLEYYGPCTVSVVLDQEGPGPGYYTAGPSPSGNNPITVPAPTLTPTGSDFSAAWVSSSTPAVSVSSGNGLITSFGSGWSFTLTDDHGATDCGTVSGRAPTVQITVASRCFAALSRSGTTWTVDVHYTYFGGTESASAQVTGTAPQPVDPAQISFTAAWYKLDKSGRPELKVSYDGPYDDSRLGQLDWTEVVYAHPADGSAAIRCNADNQTPSGSHTLRLTVDTDACPVPTDGSTPPTFTVDVSFSDPTYGTTNTYHVAVDGTLPTA